MGRGLSDLQQQILLLALEGRNAPGRAEDMENGRGADVTHRTILERVYGFEAARGSTIGSHAFSKRAIGAKRYAAAQAAISRAIRRLEERKLVIPMCGNSRWSGCNLTPWGLKLAPQLTANTLQNSAKSEPIEPAGETVNSFPVLAKCEPIAGEDLSDGKCQPLERADGDVDGSPLQTSGRAIDADGDEEEDAPKSMVERLIAERNEWLSDSIGNLHITGAQLGVHTEPELRQMLDFMKGEAEWALLQLDVLKLIADYRAGWRPGKKDYLDPHLKGLLRELQQAMDADEEELTDREKTA
jgi:hypothetical protein